MLVRALRHFPHYPDGIRRVEVATGDEIQVNETLAETLIREGIALAPTVEPANPQGEAGGQGVTGEGSTNQLTIKHADGGKYHVMDGENRVTEKPLPKAEAEALAAAGLPPAPEPTPADAGTPAPETAPAQ